MVYNLKRKKYEKFDGRHTSRSFGKFSNNAPTSPNYSEGTSNNFSQSCNILLDTSALRRPTRRTTSITLIVNSQLPECASLGGGIEERPYMHAVIPPSTNISWPLTKSLASEARYTTVPTNSSGLPHLPTGVRLQSQSLNSTFSYRAFVIAVLKYPGPMPLT